MDESGIIPHLISIVSSFKVGQLYRTNEALLAHDSALQQFCSQQMPDESQGPEY